MSFFHEYWESILVMINLKHFMFLVVMTHFSVFGEFKLMNSSIHNVFQPIDSTRPAR